MSIFLAALLLAACPAAASSLSTGTFSAVDGLYFSRNNAANLDLSIELLRQHCEDFPEDAGGFWRFGRSLVRKGETEPSADKKNAFFEAARAAAERAVSLDPEIAEAHFWLGVALGRSGQARGMMRSLFMIKPIKKAMLRALEIDPRHGGAHQALGELYRQLPGFLGGSRSKALEEMELAVAGSPGYGAAYVGLARLYLEIGETGKGRRVLKQVLEIKTPDDPGEFDENLKDARAMLENLGQ